MGGRIRSLSPHPKPPHRRCERSWSPSSGAVMCPTSNNRRLCSEPPASFSIYSSPSSPDEPMSTPPFDAPESVHVTTIAVDERRYDVSVEISHDGIEYLRLLLFTDEAWPEDAG